VRTLILGLGNPILTDDGVGIRVARILSERLSDDPDVRIAEASLAACARDAWRPRFPMSWKQC